MGADNQLFRGKKISLSFNFVNLDPLAYAKRIRTLVKIAICVVVLWSQLTGNHKDTLCSAIKTLTEKIF